MKPLVTTITLRDNNSKMQTKTTQQTKINLFNKHKLMISVVMRM